MFFGCSKLKYINLENISFYKYKDNFKSYLYSLNNDIIVCGSSDFFSTDNSLCEIGTYCINNIYDINCRVNDYHCYIKCKEYFNIANFTCPYYYPENNELINNIKYICNSVNIMDINQNINPFNEFESNIL